jgi:hypothetical protein
VAGVRQHELFQLYFLVLRTTTSRSLITCPPAFIPETIELVEVKKLNLANLVGFYNISLLNPQENGMTVKESLEGCAESGGG